MDNTQDKKSQAQRIAELLAKVPNEVRDVVTAQIIGTVNGVLIAASADKKTA